MASPRTAGNAAWDKASTEDEPKSFQLNAEDGVRFVRVVSEWARIRRHADIYRWLSGDVQHFLPHEVMLTAWGDFSGWDLKLDLTSGLPGMRTAELARCQVDGFVRHAYGRWLDAGRKPLLLKTADTPALRPDCPCPVHEGLRRMRGMLVHGVHDKRSSQDTLFIALTSGTFTKGRSLQRFFTVLDPLCAQLEAAFRRVPALVVTEPRRAGADGSHVLDLSTREMEVLESMCRGRTNVEIAAALDISPFTVKNHVQRIFRKIGVTNRTQAAARYADALRQTAATLAPEPVRAVPQTAL